MMDSTVHSLHQAYQAFMAAAVCVLEAYEFPGFSGGTKTPTTDAAVENLQQQYELLQVACDRAAQLVDSTRQRIGFECLFGEPTGGSSSTTAGETAVGIPPDITVKLEQIQREVTTLIIEIEQRASGASNSNPATATTAPLSSLDSAGVQPAANAESDACSGTTRSSQTIRGASNSNPQPGANSDANFNPATATTALPGANADCDANFNLPTATTALPGANADSDANFNPATATTALPGANADSDANFNPATATTALPGANVDSDANFNPATATTALPGANADSDANLNPATATTALPGINAASDANFNPTTALPGASADSDANFNPATTTTAPLSSLAPAGAQPGANADFDACSGTTQSSLLVENLKSPTTHIAINEAAEEEAMRNEDTKVTQDCSEEQQNVKIDSGDDVSQ